jgi:hypothetical protein
MLSEFYGAYLWNKTIGCKIVTTDTDNIMSYDNIKLIENKNILIVGSYYENNLQNIYDSANTVSIFYNSGDSYNEYNDMIEHKSYFANKYSGFATWSVNELGITDDYITRISILLDQYQYGHPSEEAFYFQNGLFYLDEIPNLNKLLDLINNDDIDKIIDNGKQLRANNLIIAKSRVELSKDVTIIFNGIPYTIRVAIGDSPILDTCIALAEKSPSGIGILIRYDLNENKTYFYIRSKKETDVNISQLSNSVVGGSGSYVMGGGVVNGFIPPHYVEHLNLFMKN